MGHPKKAGGKNAELAEEAASIEFSVKLAEQMARGGESSGWPTKTALSSSHPAITPAAEAETRAEPPVLSVPAGDDLAAEAASIEASVKLAEQMALESDLDGRAWADKKALSGAPSEGAPSPAPAGDDLAAEVASIEASVKLTEELARASDVDAGNWPTKKTISSPPPEALPLPEESAPAEAPAENDELAAEAASIEASVKLAERLVLNESVEDVAPQGDSGQQPAAEGVNMVAEGARLASSVKASLETDGEVDVWPKLAGWTGREMRRNAKYQMYLVYERCPEEMKKLVIQVIAKGCPELDEKGAKNFVNKAWKNRRLQENLQGAMNATYYRELFEGEESQASKRTIPELYLEGDNPRLVFGRMKSILFKNRDYPNRIHLLKNKQNRHRPLPKQLYELFETEKRAAAKRLKKAAEGPK